MVGAAFGRIPVARNPVVDMPAVAHNLAADRTLAAGSAADPAGRQGRHQAVRMPVVDQNLVVVGYPMAVEAAARYLGTRAVAGKTWSTPIVKSADTSY